MSRNAISVRELSITYGRLSALRKLNLEIPAGEIFGIIGPAGSGKTSFLSTLNRTLELQPTARREGQVHLFGEPIDHIPPTDLRRKVGMVLPLPVGLPLSIYDNVALAPRMAGENDRAYLDMLVENCLRQAALWDEVKDRLDLLATRLSGGQQQRLTLARALSTKPQVLCLDEFSIAIDPITTMRIEQVLLELKQSMTILLVTNLLQQAHRIADHTAFFLQGELVEEGPTTSLFGSPRDPRTADYLAGKFG
jgi:phosphate transport system ATP-binding protein